MSMMNCLLVNAAMTDWRKAVPTAELFKLGFGFDAHFSIDDNGSYYSCSTHEDREVSIINFRVLNSIYYNPYWSNLQ